MTSTRDEASQMLDPTDEQLQFAATVRRALAAVAPIEAIRRHTVGHDPVAWRALAELGVAALAIPEEHGGAGAGLTELTLVAEELGAALYNGPFLASAVLSSVLLREVGGPVATPMLAELASGRRTATVLLNDLTAADGGSARVTAREGRLTGTVPIALDAHADWLLVVADDAGLYVLERGAPGLTSTTLTTVDPLVPLYSVDLRQAPAALVSADAPAALAVAVAHADVVLRAMQVGGAQACLDMSVDYAKTRTQFGRVIGEFQAIKHKCANQLMAVESARSAAYHAAAALHAGAAGAELARSLAAAYCSQAYVQCASENIQIHGGMGFTWEHDAHLYFKRAHTTAQLLGDATSHRQLIAERLGLLKEDR